MGKNKQKRTKTKPSLTAAEKKAVALYVKLRRAVISTPKALTLEQTLAFGLMARDAAKGEMDPDLWARFFIDTRTAETRLGAALLKRFAVNRGPEVIAPDSSILMVFKRAGGLGHG